MRGRRWIFLGAASAGMSVVLGAFAAHGLNDFFARTYAGATREVAGETVSLASKYLADFKTGAEYQMTHSLGMIAAGLLSMLRGGRWPGRAAAAFLAGIVLFSGSLYVLTLTGERQLGMVAPFGGTAFIVGWLFLAMAAREKEAAPRP